MASELRICVVASVLSFPQHVMRVCYHTRHAYIGYVAVMIFTDVLHKSFMSFDSFYLMCCISLTRCLLQTLRHKGTHLMLKKTYDDPIQNIVLKNNFIF